MKLINWQHSWTLTAWWFSMKRKRKWWQRTEENVCGWKEVHIGHTHPAGGSWDRGDSIPNLIHHSSNAANEALLSLMHKWGKWGPGRRVTLRLSSGHRGETEIRVSSGRLVTTASGPWTRLFLAERCHDGKWCCRLSQCLIFSLISYNFNTMR